MRETCVPMLMVPIHRSIKGGQLGRKTVHLGAMLTRFLDEADFLIREQSGQDCVLCVGVNDLCQLMIETAQVQKASLVRLDGPSCVKQDFDFPSK